MAQSAREYALEHAEAVGASVACVHAYEDAPGTPALHDPAPAIRQQLEEVIALRTPTARNVRIDSVVRRGPPWEKLANVATELGADIIVVAKTSPACSRSSPKGTTRRTSSKLGQSSRAEAHRPARPARALATIWRTLDGRQVARCLGTELANGSYLAVCGGTYSWDDFVATLNALGHDVGVVRVAPEVYDGFFPGSKEVREMFQYFEAHTYFGPDARSAIAAANALVPGGFTGFSQWARQNMKPGL